MLDADAKLSTELTDCDSLRFDLARVKAGNGCRYNEGREGRGGRGNGDIITTFDKYYWIHDPKYGHTSKDHSKYAPGHKEDAIVTAMLGVEKQSGKAGTKMNIQR